MNQIAVLYPTAFNCSSKFNRKLNNILKNLDSPRLFIFNDVNNLGEQYAKSNGIDYQLCFGHLNLNDASFTHAIIFSDGEEFIAEVSAVRSSSIKVSVQRISITKVVNIKRDPIYNGKINTDKYEYIGRGSLWGNPYAIGENGDDREEVLRKYKYDFDYDKFLNINKNDMIKLSGKRLGCFCKPDDCHGDIIADFLNSYDDGQ